MEHRPKPIIDYGKPLARRARRSAFMTEYGPTLGVLLAVPGLLGSFLSIGATMDAGARIVFPTPANVLATGEYAVVSAISVGCTIVAFRWICEPGEFDDAENE